MGVSPACPCSQWPRDLSPLSEQLLSQVTLTQPRPDDTTATWLPPAQVLSILASGAWNLLPLPERRALCAWWG